MKQPNWKIPLVLSATLAVFGIFTYWLEYSHRPKQEKADTAIKQPIHFESDQVIQAFKIQGHPLTVEGKCLNLASKKCTSSNLGEWEVTLLNTQTSKSDTYKADPENIKSLLSTFQNTVATETISLSDEPAEKKKSLFEEYGLGEVARKSATALSLEIDFENGQKLQSWLGVDHPIGDKTFVASSINGKLNENTVFLISNFFKTNFEHDETYFRDKTIFNFDRTQIEAFQATTPKGKLNAKKADKTWTINNIKASYERTETTLAYLAQIKAKSFTHSPQAPAGSRLLLDFTFQKTEEPKKLTVQIFEKTTPAKTKGATGEKAYYLKTSARPDVVEVESFAYSRLNLSLTDFRNVELLNETIKTTLTQAKLSGTQLKEAYEFTLKNGKWSGNAKVDSQKFSDLLDQLTKSSIKDFVKPFSGRALFSLTLGDAKNSSFVQWEFFEKSNHYYIKDLAHLQEWYELDDAIKTYLPLGSEPWKVKP